MVHFQRSSREKIWSPDSAGRWWRPKIRGFQNQLTLGPLSHQLFKGFTEYKFIHPRSSLISGFRQTINSRMCVWKKPGVFSSESSSKVPPIFLVKWYLFSREGGSLLRFPWWCILFLMSGGGQVLQLKQTEPGGSSLNQPMFYLVAQQQKPCGLIMKKWSWTQENNHRITKNEGLIQLIPSTIAGSQNVEGSRLDFSDVYHGTKLKRLSIVLLLMAEILHQLMGSVSHCLYRFYTSQVVQDFFHQQYES